MKTFVGAALAVGAASGSSRVLDRTFSCATGYLGGIYQVRIATDWSAPQGSQKLEPSASASTNLEHGFLGDIGRVSMDVNRVNCQATSQKVPLTTTGLSGGAFSRLPTEYACETSRLSRSKKQIYTSQACRED